MNTVKAVSTSMMTLFAGLMLSVLITGCTTARRPEEPVTSRTVTFGSIREEVRIVYDDGTLQPSGYETNRFVFPVSYTVEGEETLNELQVLFDRYRTVQGKEPRSIHDDSAIGFFEIVDTLGGTADPDYLIREKDISKIRPVLLGPWLQKIREDLDGFQRGDVPLRPRRDRP